MQNGHTFHIPVMGTGFTLDTPIKVAKFGITSVISLVDDTLVEQARKFHCTHAGEKYVAITRKDDDYRAKRITAYLNLVQKIINAQFEKLKNSAFEAGSEITEYFDLLPSSSPLRILYEKMLLETNETEKLRLQDDLRSQIFPGSIDVNIMTKLNRPNYAQDGRELGNEYSDALAALRGFANSTLESSVEFSAGFNRLLYGYVENFNDFYADASGFIKKKIAIKVSDYRSCLTQGKFLAKKGLWVSEYRIESGLNCGGHVFPTAGILMGPILQEFLDKKPELTSNLHAMYNLARRLKKMAMIPKPHPTIITAQGGIGTYEEHNFLFEYYKIDQTGWATPFLLCPEVANVDEITLQKLCDAKEKDLYTSDVSPVGAPFNNLRNSLSELEKERRVLENKPGSPCPKGHLAFSLEFSSRPICVASARYQALKFKQLDNQKLTRKQYETAQSNTFQKSCICHDLGGGFMIKNNLLGPNEKAFPAICPGPNIAYFSRIYTLKELVDHIYGRINLLEANKPPHMFLKELAVNIDFLENEIKKYPPIPPPKDILYFLQFWHNLRSGIDYYKNLLRKSNGEPTKLSQSLKAPLMALRARLDKIVNDANLNAKMVISEKLHALKDNIKRPHEKQDEEDS